MSEEEIANLPLDELVGLQKDVNSTIIDSEYIGIQTMVCFEGNI